MVLDDKGFAGLERGADVEGIEEAVAAADGPNESQGGPKESVMRAQAPEDDERSGRIGVFDTDDAALQLQQREPVDAVAVPDRVGHGGENGLFGDEGARGGFRVGVDHFANEVSVLASDHCSSLFCSVFCFCAITLCSYVFF